MKNLRKLILLPLLLLFFSYTPQLFAQERIERVNSEYGTYAVVVNIVHMTAVGTSGAACGGGVVTGNLPLAGIGCASLVTLLKKADAVGTFAEDGCTFVVNKLRLGNDIDCTVKMYSDSETKLKDALRAIDELKEAITN